MFLQKSFIIRIQVGLNHNVECKILRNFRGTSFVKEDNGNVALEAVLPMRLLQVEAILGLFQFSNFLIQVVKKA